MMLNFMSESSQINVSKTCVSKLAIVALAIVFAVGLFLVGYDQGHLFSIVLGEQAFEDIYLHELTHDMRHAAVFPFLIIEKSIARDSESASASITF